MVNQEKAVLEVVRRNLFAKSKGKCVVNVKLSREGKGSDYREKGKAK